MKRLLILLLFISVMVCQAQTILTVTGQTINNSDDTWLGYNVSRGTPTSFIFSNNSITSVNRYGYLLQAGDEGINSNNNNLDGEIITGNKLNWSGTKSNSIIPHGIFAGNNINAVIKYNYLNEVPMAIISKSASNMVNTSGGIAYNIVKGGSVAVNIKGISGVKIYNNTLYSNRTTSETYRGLVDIYTNTDMSPASKAHGTKIFNNIFYTRYATYCIQIDDADALIDLESDYNIFYSESGTVLFDYCGTTKTFAQWQALGYDVHSKIVNPNFIDFIDFVPATRLDYGTNIGTEWLAGLSTNAAWSVGSSPATTSQNGTWQVGARIYNSSSVSVYYVSSVIENATPNNIDITYNSSLANIVPAASAFNVKVNSVNRTVSSVAIVEGKVRLVLTSPVVYSDVITIAYVKPATNPLQSVSGQHIESISAQQVINNLIAPGSNPSPPTISMTIYPNPVYKILNISFTYTNIALSPQIIRILDISGKLFIEKLLVTGIANTRFPINLNSGIYIVLLFSGNMQMASQKIIVLK
jgi:hypothetical protein